MNDQIPVNALFQPNFLIPYQVMSKKVSPWTCCILTFSFAYRSSWKENKRFILRVQGARCVYIMPFCAGTGLDHIKFINSFLSPVSIDRFFSFLYLPFRRSHLCSSFFNMKAAGLPLFGAALALFALVTYGNVICNT